MPQTRRSTEVPVRATRSQGTASVAKNKNTPKSTASNSDSKDVSKSQPAQSSSGLAKIAEHKTGNHGKEQSDETRKESSLSNKASSEQISSETVAKTEVGDGKSEETMPEPVVKPKMRKRPAAELETESTVVKKSRSSTDNVAASQIVASSQTAVFSPRRSSRAVIPNSRFKDMEMLDTGKKKSEGKTSEKSKEKKTAVKKVRVPAPRKINKSGQTPDSIADDGQLPQSEQEMVTEEIITEETTIDSQAQMNFLDEMLILPSTATTTAADAPASCIQQKILPPIVHNVGVTSDTSLVSDTPPASDTPTISETPLLQNETTPVSHAVSDMRTQVIGEIDSSLPISQVECKKVLSAYEIHRHLEPSCTQPSISSQPVLDIKIIPIQSQTGDASTADTSLHNPNMDSTDYTNTDKHGAPVEYHTSAENMEVMKADLIGRQEAVPSVSDTVKAMRKPQVIVVKSSAALLKEHKISKDAHANLMPKFDDMKKRLAEQYWQGPVKPTGKPNIVVVGKDNTQKMTRRVIVTPTHTARNEAVKKAKAIVKANDSEIKIIEIPDKYEVTSSSDEAGNLISKVSKEEKIESEIPIENDGVSAVSLSGDNVEIKTELVEIGANQTDGSDPPYTSTVPESTITSLEEDNTAGELSQLVDTTDDGAAGTEHTQPHVVYFKIKPKIQEPTATTKLRYEIITSPTKIAEFQAKEALANQTDIPKYIGNFQEETVDISNMGENTENFEEVISNTDEIDKEAVSNENDTDDNFVYSSKDQVIEEEEDSSVADDNVVTELYNNQDDQVEALSEMASDQVNQAAVSKLCQVLPVEAHREVAPIQTAIEYVVFGDKMIPIHKPLSQAHGRITTMAAGKAPSWRQHGRVEIPGQEMNTTPGLVKKISMDVAQTAINSVLEQIGDEKEGSSVVLTTVDGLPQATSAALGQDQTETADMQIAEPGEDSNGVTEDGEGEQTRVIHGYVDRVTGTIEPTQIVEISQDLFAKEVYGDVVTVDPITGELIPVSLSSSEPMIIDDTNNVAMVTADSAAEGQDVTFTTEAVEGVNVTDGTIHVVTALPVPSAESGQTEDQSAQDENQPEYIEIPSADTGNQSEQNVDQSADNTLNQSVDNQSSLVKNRTSSGESQTDSHTSLTKPALEFEEQVETDSSVDPKVTTHYNKDGSMTIRIEGTNSSQERNISKVTIPNIVKVAPSRPQILTQKAQRYVTIQNMKDTQITNQSKEPAYKTLTNVKINPAIGVKEVLQTSKETENIKIEPTATSLTAKVVSVATSTQTQTEMETQTEISDEEEDGEEEEGINVDEHELLVMSGDKVKRTTKMTMGEDGHIQEYVVVSLPEGTEIKHARGRVQMQRDPVHDEVVTMGEDGMYICMDCDHKTDKKSNWYKHRRKHLGIRPHACDRCNYKAATSSNLKRHMQIHDDIRNFVCSICSLMFRQKIHLERHIKYKHQEKKVKCPLCDYLCTSENPDLKIHIRRRHMPHEGGGMAAFTCEECGLMTVSKKDLKQHMKFHKKGPELKLFCEYCSFVTDCESRLRRHMLIHTKEKPFQCGLCSYRASQKEHVLRHMRSQHDVEVERKQRRSLIEVGGSKDKRKTSSPDDEAEGSFPYKDLSDDSQDVDKTFEKSDYSSTDKIFACNHCSMKFSKLINLYKHLYAQHRQVMPDPNDSDFQCVVCDFRTNNKKNLLVHMRKHNMQDHTPPSHVYSCVLCHYINPRRRNLFQHMKKKHGIEIVMKEDGSNCYVTSSVSSAVVLGGQAGETQIKPLSEIITMEAIDDDTQLEIVTEDGNTFQGEKISIDNIISVEDIATYASGSSEQHSPQTNIVTSSLYQTVAEHEAAEAIQGLQALAQQPGVLETQTIDNDITTEIVTSEILSGEEVMSQEETLIEQVEDSGIQLSSEQINQLSSGDYVEINGEVYKVEIAQESAAK